METMDEDEHELRLHIGQIVRLVGLTGADQFNGALAKVVGPFAMQEENRYPVQLIDERQTRLSIQPRNVLCNIAIAMKHTNYLDDVYTHGRNIYGNNAVDHYFGAMLLFSKDMLSEIFSFLVPSSLAIDDNTTAVDGQLNELHLVCKYWQSLIAQFVHRVELCHVRCHAFQQKHLNRIANAYPFITRLEIICDADDDHGSAGAPPSIDFSVISLPRLESLTLSSVSGLANVFFNRDTTPNLQCLDIESCGKCSYLYLELAHLEILSFESFENVWIADTSEFGRSIYRCPQLVSIDCHPFRGQYSRTNGDPCHYIFSEKLRTLELHRSDVLEALMIIAPNANRVGGRACYGLEYIRVFDALSEKEKTQIKCDSELDECANESIFGQHQSRSRSRKHTEHEVEVEVNVESQKQLTKMHVNLMHSRTSIDEESLNHLTNHPRMAHIM